MNELLLEFLFGIEVVKAASSPLQQQQPHGRINVSQCPIHFLTPVYTYWVWACKAFWEWQGNTIPLNLRAPYHPPEMHAWCETALANSYDQSGQCRAAIAMANDMCPGGGHSQHPFILGTWDRCPSHTHLSYVAVNLCCFIQFSVRG